MSDIGAHIEKFHCAPLTIAPKVAKARGEAINEAKFWKLHHEWSLISKNQEHFELLSDPPPPDARVVKPRFRCKICNITFRTSPSNMICHNNDHKARRYIKIGRITTYGKQISAYEGEFTPSLEDNTISDDVVVPKDVERRGKFILCRNTSRGCKLKIDFYGEFCNSQTKCIRANKMQDHETHCKFRAKK